MANLKYKTRGNSSPQGKPRVYFCCHPKDFKQYFELVSNEILMQQNCAIWYADEAIVRDEEFFADLQQMQLFVLPVTTNLLRTENEALDIDFNFAIKNHIPVLPLMQEPKLVNLFNQKCGEIQYLDKSNQDITAISYEEKLKKRLESVLVGDELAEKVRAAFDAYVFLSYRKKDRKYAQELMRLIHKNDFCRDIAIWYDEFLTPGENFNESIREALLKSGLFVLAVTPNIVNEMNYIMTTEYPMARQEGKPILPAELMPTDRAQLTEKYEHIPTPIDVYNKSKFSEALLSVVEKIAIKKNDLSPEHNFFIGLAYLSGIDVEVDRQRAVELITDAANSNLPEAMEKLIMMYSDGVGVSSDKDIALNWSQRLANYYYERCFDNFGKLCAPEEVFDLFRHYHNPYWSNVIVAFLHKTDANLNESVLKELYALIMSYDIAEYTLLFEACRDMAHFGEEANIIIVTDILKKSVEGIYPPYGPLFWYIPEYNLYKVAITALERLKKDSAFAKMLALIRDVCFIFGTVNTLNEITAQVDATSLYEAAKANLSGVRAALCELFCTGTTDYEFGEDIYPRCFNVAEAKAFAETGCGIYGVMGTPFNDELELYSHFSYNETGGEYVGFVSAPYDIETIEHDLSQKSCAKLRGLSLSPTEDRTMKYIAINRTHLKVFYIPENIVFDSLETAAWRDDLSLIHSVVFQPAYKHTRHDSVDRYKQNTDHASKMYIREKVIIPQCLEYVPTFMLKGCKNVTTVCLHEGIKIIERGAFLECSNLRSIHLPNGIAGIRSFAFSGCSSLKSIDIPGTVEFIGEGAFDKCTSLLSVHISEGVDRIFSGAFADCVNLVTVNIPKSITHLISSFYGCESLEYIHIPNDSTRLEAGTFSGCKKLVSANIPKKSTDIARNMFAGCANLVEIEIPENVTFIGDTAFYGCKNLTSLSIPNSVTGIGENAFCQCKKLTSLYLSTNLREIRMGAFFGCEGLKSVYIPDSVAKIEAGAFKGCACLSVVCISKKTYIDPEAFEENVEFVFYETSLTDIVIPDGVKSIAEKEYQHRRDIKCVQIPNSVTEIGHYAFDGCINLLSVQLPRSTNKLGWYAFQDCVKLASISIPECVSEIGNWAFCRCKNLSSVAISDNTKIGAGAFSECYNLLSVKIPKTQTEIEWRTFESCKKLISINIPESITKIDKEAFIYCGELVDVYIPDSVLEVEEGAFEWCTKLRTIHIPKMLKRISRRVFSRCLDLTSVTVPPSVTEIGCKSFLRCISLASVALPDTLQLIGQSAFEGCVSLTSISIPDGVKRIFKAAFAECLKLTSLFIPNSVTDLDNLAFAKCSTLEVVHLSENLSRISDGVFLGCYDLAEVHIPDKVIEIGKGAFWGCKSLKAINIPDGVCKIKDFAFGNCESLESIQFPEGLSEIGKTAFEKCTHMKKIEIPASVRIIGDGAFKDCDNLNSVTISYRFESDIERIFGDIDPHIITFV